MKMVKAAVIFTAALAFGSAFSACNTSAESKTYTVTWKNYDGAVLETDTDVAEGAAPAYDGAAPAKPADADNTYSFSGWNPALAPVTADAVYTAQFTATAIPALCTCPVKAHLGIGETCPCGGADCDCTLKVYGNLADGTPIYRSGNVSDTEMATAVANAQAGYNTLDNDMKSALVGKIDEIRIVPTTGANWTYKNEGGKLILEAKCNRSDTHFLNKFVSIKDGESPMVALIRSNNAIRIARVNAGAPSHQRHGAFLGAGHFDPPKGVTRPAVFG